MYQTIPQLLKEISTNYPTNSIQMYKDDNGNFLSVSYKDFYTQVNQLAQALLLLNVKRGDNVGLISDNRKEWLLADNAILALGAVDVPRGRDAMPNELKFILDVSECSLSFVENEDQLQKILAILPSLPKLKTLVVMDSSHHTSLLEGKVPEGVSILTFNSLIEKGSEELKKEPTRIEKEIAKGKSSDLATIIFTSGTTGEPKGVMLSHRNFTFQLEQLPKVIDFKKGERWLSVLPVWHSFERILQYVIIDQASTVVYSKPIGKIMLVDLQRVNPQWMGSVPRIWEAVKAGVYQNVKTKSIVARSLFHFFVFIGAHHTNALNLVTNTKPQFKKRFYPLDLLIGVILLVILTPFKLLGDVLVFNTIKKKFGNNFRAGVSGGGSLPAPIDKFFKAIGVTLLDGYGLTETAPVIGLRKISHQVPETVAPLPETKIKIVKEDGSLARPGEKGVIWAKGEQVMMGYYKRDDLTKAIMDKEGFINTGDIGMWTHKGEYAIKGRAKDTIVLSGGENIEPIPIEAKLRESEYIEQVMVVGQDKKYLGALIVVDTKQIELFVKENNIPYMTRGDLLGLVEVKNLIQSEINELVSTKTGLKGYEHIARFALTSQSFKIGEQLSAKQEVMRHKVTEQYKKEIDALFI
ncbi:MAG: long-chain fatty acid--CoA ligase [Spirochaetia bacterium]|nr:long-chain fatty acid--CoA ligase [Spirochaetia bacterium]